MNFEEIMRKNLVRFLVQKSIFCPITGEVLDIDSCVVILDPDGDPSMVISPEGYRLTASLLESDPSAALAEGFSFDISTLPS